MQIKEAGKQRNQIKGGLISFDAFLTWSGEADRQLQYYVITLSATD